MDTKKLILDCVNSILKKNTAIIYGVLSKVKGSPKQFYMESVCQSLEDSEYSVSFRLKEKHRNLDNQFKYHIEKEKREDKIAIVLQGPVRKEDDYTLRTVEYYRSLYPDAIVIVSTWSDENPIILDKIRACRCEVVMSDMPTYGGHLNINYQLVNTLAGLKKAKDLGATYVAKTRTDQCIEKPHAFEYMVNLLKQFPTANPERQNKRLITLSMNYGNMFYPYFMSDFLYFGTVDDVINVFSIPLDERKKFAMAPESSRRDYSEKMYAPEVYLMKHYLMNIGYKGDGTLEDYWKAVKESLICVDMKTLDLDWPKYNGKYSLHSFYGDYFWDDTPDKMKTVNFDFVNWFNLYSGSLIYRPEYEKYVDVIFK